LTFFLRLKTTAEVLRRKVILTKPASPVFSVLKVMPHSRLTFFGRYVHGFSNMSKVDDGTVPKYKNQNIQVGLKLRLFGKKKVNNSGNYSYNSTSASRQ
jgi:hypothetical protein